MAEWKISVKRIVEREIDVVVEARSEDEARGLGVKKARDGDWDMEFDLEERNRFYYAVSAAVQGED